jgi:hypothetical protein
LVHCRGDNVARARERQRFLRRDAHRGFAFARAEVIIAAPVSLRYQRREPLFPSLHSPLCCINFETRPVQPV